MGKTAGDSQLARQDVIAMTSKDEALLELRLRRMERKLNNVRDGLLCLCQVLKEVTQILQRESEE